MLTESKFSNFENKDFAFLRSVVGEENVSTDEAELVINSMDSFPGEPVKPDVVVWPESTEQVSKIVMYANEGMLTVDPRGGFSCLYCNVVPVYLG